jgi:MSHA biogenesis protein MshJ
MGALLEQVLNQNGRLQLVALETLAATPLLDTPALKPANTAAPSGANGQERQVYKHGVRLTVRGSYADLVQYLTALEKLPTQMFWGSAKMSVQQYPVTEMTLILYTLSLDTVWLQV